jgi:hypothetical protein
MGGVRCAGGRGPSSRQALITACVKKNSVSLVIWPSEVGALEHFPHPLTPATIHT